MSKKIIDKCEYKIICNQEFDEENIIPTFCKICESTIRTEDDSKSASKFKACFNCSVDFIYPNIELWKDGWRPSRDEINSKLKLRSAIMLNIGLSL